MDGSGIKASMNDKQVGYQSSLPGEVEGVGFDVFYRKYPDYNMMLMSAYVQMEVKGGQRENIRHVEEPATGESNIE